MSLKKENKFKVVKNFLLKKKADEFFSKNPSANSVIVEFPNNKGSIRSYFEVRKGKKNKDSLIVTEVLAKSNVYCLTEAEGSEPSIPSPTPSEPTGAARPKSKKPGRKMAKQGPTPKLIDPSTSVKQKMQKSPSAQPPTARTPSGTKVLPKQEPTSTASVAAPDVPKIHQPEPMDDLDSGPADPEATKQAAKKDIAGFKELLKWNPVGMDNEFTKTYQQTGGSFEKTIEKMPPADFKRAFGHLGAQSPADLTSDQQKLQKAKDFVSRLNPQIK